ncbi:Nucleolar transcription factor 1 [Lamellibrachia satsuma]|nr:Nucleolar transcription factor 1 [Lamellibrachia satsuma]
MGGVTKRSRRESKRERRSKREDKSISRQDGRTTGEAHGRINEVTGGYFSRRRFGDFRNIGRFKMASVVDHHEASTPAGHKRTRHRQHRPADRGDQPPSEAPQSDNDDAELSPAKKPKLEVTGGSGDHLHAEENSKVEIWSSKNINELLGRIKQALPTMDNLKYSTQMDRLDWTTVEFGEYSGEDCKKQWNNIAIKLRRFRTMTELVQDAAVWVKNPISWTNKRSVKKPPGMPKKPLTPYFRFFIEKRSKVSKEHPELSTTDLARHLSEKYRALPDHKKMKYTDAYIQENEPYKAVFVVSDEMKYTDAYIQKNERIRLYLLFQMKYTDAYIQKNEQYKAVFVVSDEMKYTDAYIQENEQYKAVFARYKEENPDFFQTQHSSTPEYKPKVGGCAPKPTTAVQIYINNKVAEHLKKYPKVSKKQLYELYRKRWSQMADNKKMKYIKKALEAKEKYDANMEKFCELNPNYKPKEVKSFLTKAEQKVKDRHGGKPDKPPINGFNLFTSRLMLSDFPSNQRMAEISRRWKALTDTERAAFNNDAQRKMAAYNEQYQKYLESLPEDERVALGGTTIKKAESPPASPEKKNSAKPQTVERLTKPIAPMFIFMDEKESDYRKKNPKMDKKELSRLMLQDFNSLPAKEKAKYRKLAAQRKEKLAQQNKENAQAQEKTKKVVKLHFPGEPKKPPGSGYHLFSTTMLTSLTHVMHTERMAEIARQWRKMSTEEQKEYTTKRDALHQHHAKALEQFKKGLSPKDLKRYEEYEKAKKVKKPSQPSKTSTKDNSEKTKESDSESGSEASDAESSSESESGSSSASEEVEEDAEKQQWAASNGLQKKEGKLQAGDVYGDDDDDDDDDDDSNDSVSASSGEESEAETESDSDSDD